MEIKGTTGSRGRGRLAPAKMVNLSKRREIPGMRNQMLLIKEMNSFLYIRGILRSKMALLRKMYNKNKLYKNQ